MAKVTVDIYRKRRWFGWKWVNSVTCDRERAELMTVEGQPYRLFGSTFKVKWRRDV